jgi:hypothetical protein
MFMRKREGGICVNLLRSGPLGLEFRMLATVHKSR